MKNKFKSYGFWTALSGAVIVFINALGRAFGFKVDNEIIDNIIMAFAGILVVFGVVFMPKQKEEQVEENKNEEENEDK